MATPEARLKRTARLGPGILVGERVVMRPVSRDDLPRLQAWDEDPAIVALMGRKFARMTVYDWFESLGPEGRCVAWGIETRDGRLVGELELADINWRDGTAELRICIGEKDCWNRGYGTEAIRLALSHAFERMGLAMVYLRVFRSNERAVRLYVKMGFQAEALLPPSSRRGDPSPVLLMTLSRDRWVRPVDKDSVRAL